MGNCLLVVGRPRAELIQSIALGPPLSAYIFHEELTSALRVADTSNGHCQNNVCIINQIIEYHTVTADLHRAGLLHDKQPALALEVKVRVLGSISHR